MEDWQQRVIDEKAALDEKLEQLRRWMTTDEFHDLGPDQRHLFTLQAHHMGQYSQVLAERIKLF